MIDYLVENQLSKMQLPHQPQQQEQFRQIPASCSNLIEVPPTNNQQNASTNNNNSNSNSNSSNNNELIGYYFGSISRETADWILRNHGNQMDGAYLLRSSGPNDDFVLSLMVVTTMPNNSSITCQQQNLMSSTISHQPISQHIEVLHYKIVETEDSFVALHGQVGDEKFATIDELIDKAQGVATKPRWPIHRQALESQILPPTYWGLSVYQVCLAFFIKAKQWGFPLLPSLFQPPQQTTATSTSEQQQQMTSTSCSISTDNGGVGGGGGGVTTLSIETMRTLIYKSLHEFQPWFHGKISRDEAEGRIMEMDGFTRDGKFLVRERDNYSYAMCICHRRATKHYRIDVLPTGELAIQDGRKFTSLMALVSHYTIMSDGLWCALTEPCPRPIQPAGPPQQAHTASGCFGNPNNLQQQQQQHPDPACSSLFSPSIMQQQNRTLQYASPNGQNLYCVPPPPPPLPLPSSCLTLGQQLTNMNMLAPPAINRSHPNNQTTSDNSVSSSSSKNNNNNLTCAHPGAVTSLKAPIKEWLQTINQKWSQLMAAKSQHQSLNSFLFGSQNPLNNHCRHNRSRHHHHHHHHHHNNNHSGEQRRKSHKNGQSNSCGCAHLHQQQPQQLHQVDINNVSSMATRNNHGTSSGQMMTSRQPLELANGRYQQQQDSQRSLLARTVPPPIASQFLATSDPATTALNMMNPSSILNCLPQNSGFQLNGQSFIGSPLFAVVNNSKPGRQCATGSAGPRSQGGSSGGSSGGGGGITNGNIIEQPDQEKLISPAQSISVNLNHEQVTTNGYNTSHLNDIYGSQPSTAIVNDNVAQPNLPLTSSSSSSGTINLHNQTTANRFSCQTSSKSQQHQQQGIPPLVGNNWQQRQQRRQLPFTAKDVPAFQTGGHILCGQHAGPAYRYTNCQNDDLSACPHRNNIQPHQGTTTTTTTLDAMRSRRRAYDDSQLQLDWQQSQSQNLLGGQAAQLSKFVQFQDGQCLRTHRDTRSIQMAYLSSQRAQHMLNLQHNSQQRAQSGQLQPPAQTIRAPNNRNDYNSKNPMGVPAGGQIHEFQEQFGSRSEREASRNEYPFMGMPTKQGETTLDVDLMDCGNVDFKVDPRLIKSSSIETLCGVGDDDENCDYDDEADQEELNNVLINCKSNAELLQACFKFNESPFSCPDNQTVKTTTSQFGANILKPIQVQDVNNNNSNSTNEVEAGNDGPRQAVELLDNLEKQQGNKAWNLGATNMIGPKDTLHREKLEYLSKKHDLDELYTAVFAELDASLKAQVELKNKCLGFNSASSKGDQSSQHSSQQQTKAPANQNNNIMETKDPSELIYEFDSLIPSNNKNNSS